MSERGAPSAPEKLIRTIRTVRIGGYAHDSKGTAAEPAICIGSATAGRAALSLFSIAMCSVAEADGWRGESPDQPCTDEVAPPPAEAAATSNDG